ncbi:MAG: hypothetical protein ABIH41_05370 [Nanoarchaeota archaeon]
MRTVLATELDSLRAMQARSQELVAKLITSEGDLAAMVARAKVAATILTHKLTTMMQKYPFLRSTWNSRLNENEFTAHSNHMFPAKGNHSTEQVVEGMRRGVNINDLDATSGADIILQRSVARLLRMTQILDELARLVKKEVDDTNELQASTSILQRVMAAYSRVHDELFRYDKLIAFEENVLRGLKEGRLADANIDEVNKKIVLLVKELVMLVSKVKIDLSSKHVGVFFPEFDALQQDLIKDADGLGHIIIDEIERNVELTEQLLDLDDSDVVAALRAFDRELQDKLKRLGKDLLKAGA